MLELGSKRAPTQDQSFEWGHPKTTWTSTWLLEKVRDDVETVAIVIWVRLDNGRFRIPIYNVELFRSPVFVPFTFIGVVAAICMIR